MSIAIQHLKNSQPTVTDHCDCQNASLNGHHDLKQLLPYFKIADQIYDRNIAQAIKNMEMVGNNLTS